MPRAIICATTFQIRYESALLTARQWDAAIRRAMHRANDIYGRHGILFALSDVAHLSEEASMSLLTQNIREESQLPGLRNNPQFQLERMSDAYSHRAAGGTNRPFNYGGFLVQAFPSGVRVTSHTPASKEVLGILRYNHRAGQIATYWVPGFNAGYHGITYLPETNPGITRANEGIFISYHAATDILAHELGHFLMRAGHCTFEGPDGAREGSPPPTNLMHRDNDLRTGTDLTAGQIDRMLKESRAYLQ